MTVTDPIAAAQPEPIVQPTTTSGLDPKVGGLLAYLFGWIGGLIVYLTQKDPEVRFHAAQSLLFNVAYLVAFFGVWTLSFIGIMAQSTALTVLFSLLLFAVVGAFFVTWIVMCVKGYKLAHTKLPVIGDIAERWATK